MTLDFEPYVQSRPPRTRGIGESMTTFDELWNNEIRHDLGITDRNMKRDRPYNGQPHTDTGERGRTEVRGVTFRDLRDCYIRAWFLASGHISKAKYDEACKGENAALSEHDLYGFDLDKVDPMAVFQNFSCEVEKLMGIFPNVPPLKFNPPGEGKV